MSGTLTLRIAALAAAAAFLGAFHFSAGRNGGAGAPHGAAAVPARAVFQAPAARPRLSAVAPVPALRVIRHRHRHHAARRLVSAPATPAPTPVAKPVATAAPAPAPAPMATPAVRPAAPSYVGQGFDSRG